MSLKNKKENILIISIEETNIECKDCHILNWCSYFYEKNKNIYSLPNLIDQNKDFYKSKYLEFLFNLGETKIDEKSLVDFLEIRPNLSYWWMTLLNEKCNAIKSPQIDNAIKLLAFENWLNSKKYTKICLKSSDMELTESLRNLSYKLNIKFEIEKIERSLGKKKKNFQNRFPTLLHALSWFILRIVKRWSLKGAGVKQWKTTTAKTTIVSYLFNLPSESIKDGIFRSSHWAELPVELSRKNIKSNWLHLFNPDRNLPNAKLAKKTIIKFNNKQKSNQVHVTLDSFLSFKVIINVLIDWVFLINSYKKIKKLLCAESDYLWPMIRNDYKSSMLGSVAIENLLHLNLFQEALTSIPKQKKGFYLQENQGWEYGFISSWYFSKHSRYLTGIPHSTIRYWDLRYFFDKRSYNAKVFGCSLPLPDYIGINGEKGKDMLISGGYPKEKILEVEALRYQYLNQVKMHSKINNHEILVLGGKNIDKQMKLLNEVDQMIEKSINFVIKTDPWNPIKLNEFEKQRMKLTTEPMSEVLGKYNIVFTDDITSAAVDAYCLGKKVISMIDPSVLNLSPLLDNREVVFVNSAEQLGKVLNNTLGFRMVNRDFFYLDSNLSRWSKLLNEDYIS